MQSVSTVHLSGAVQHTERIDLKVHVLHNFEIEILMICVCVVEGLVKAQKS